MFCKVFANILTLREGFKKKLEFSADLPPKKDGNFFRSRLHKAFFSVLFSVFSKRKQKLDYSTLS